MFEGSRSPASHAVNLRRRTHCRLRSSLRRGAAAVLGAAGLLAAAALLLVIVLLPAVSKRRDEAFVEED